MPFYYADRFKQRRADELARKLTSANTLHELVSARHGAIPRLPRDRSPEHAELADIYDETQQFRCDPRRAFRS